MKKTTDFQRNLQAAWDQVTEVDIELGHDAYHVYHRTLRSWAAYYGFGFVQTVEAFVALSPNNDYHGNLRSLSSCMAGLRGGYDAESIVVSTYKACRDRALGYLTGEVSFLDTVGGEKITSFRHNILYPDDSKRATIDGHLIAILTGHPKITMKEATFLLRDYGGYKPLERALVLFARRIGRPASSTQAILWTWRKRQQGIKFSTQLSLLPGEEKTPWSRPLTPEEQPPYGDYWDPNDHVFR